MPSISLVIASFNRAAPLEKLLRLLKSQTLPQGQWEVLVVVDGSRDDTLDRLRGLDAEESLPLSWFFQENAGQCVARHKAILRSTSSRIVIVDDDLVPCDEFLEMHLRALERHGPRTVILGKVVPMADWRTRPLYELVREYDADARNRAFESGHIAPSGVDLITQNVSFYKDFYLEVGGFDSEMRLGEDTLLGMKMEQAGGRFMYDASAWAVHESNIGSYTTWLKRQYDYGRYTWMAWRKTGEQLNAHPLRAFVEGSSLNRLIVTLFVRSDRATNLAVALLHTLGRLLQSAGAVAPAVASHKAIMSLKQHQGLRATYGSWRAMRMAEREFRKQTRARMRNRVNPHGVLPS